MEGGRGGEGVGGRDGGGRGLAREPEGGDGKTGGEERKKEGEAQRGFFFSGGNSYTRTHTSELEMEMEGRPGEIFQVEERRSDADGRREAASQRDDWGDKIGGDRLLNAVITTHGVTSAQGEMFLGCFVCFFPIPSDVTASFPVRFHKRIRIKLVNTQRRPATLSQLGDD